MINYYYGDTIYLGSDCMQWMIIIPILLFAAGGVLYGLRLTRQRREPIRPMLVIFAAAVGVRGLTYIVMALLPGADGGFITLSGYIITLILVFLLFTLLTYPATWLCRYVKIAAKNTIRRKR